MLHGLKSKCGTFRIQSGLRRYPRVRVLCTGVPVSRLPCLQLQTAAEIQQLNRNNNRIIATRTSLLCCITQISRSHHIRLGLHALGLQVADTCVGFCQGDSWRTWHLKATGITTCDVGGTISLTAPDAFSIVESLQIKSNAVCRRFPPVLENIFEN